MASIYVSLSALDPGKQGLKHKYEGFIVKNPNTFSA